MVTISATCLAIGLAIQNNTIKCIERPSRLGGTYIAIEDDTGVIEVADTMEEANARIDRIRESVS